MKRRNNTIITCLILTINLLFCSCTQKQKLNDNDKKRTVAVIVKTKSGDYWDSVKMGTDIAAKEFNINVEFMAPDDEEDIDAQIKFISKSIDKKVDAIVVAPSDYMALVDIVQRAIEHKIPVITIDSELNTDAVNCLISTDNFEAGKRAGEKLVQINGEYSKVAIMGFVKGNPNGDKREEGFLKAISKYPDIEVVAKRYCSSNSTLATILTKNILSQDNRIDAIIALNSTSAEGVAQAIDELDLSGKVKIIAFDNTLREINYIEKGIIQSIIIQNPLSMGYLGIKYANSIIDGKKIPKKVNIDSKVIDKENMYSPENQKLLFPFVK